MQVTDPVKKRGNHWPEAYARNAPGIFSDPVASAVNITPLCDAVVTSSFGERKQMNQKAARVPHAVRNVACRHCGCRLYAVGPAGTPTAQIDLPFFGNQRNIGVA